MKSLAVACAFIFLTSGCGGGGDSGGGAGSPPLPATTANVLTVSVGASSVCRNVNELCAQVTICQPGTSSCQTIPDILVDIGSFGLRIFGSVLSPSLVQEVDSQNNPIGECVFFADGTAFWGPVQRADVVLGGEPAVNVPIHVIAPTFAGQSSSQNPCNSLVDSNPQDVFFNGILGIGVFAQDCGPFCATHSNNTLYFSCVVSTSTCAGTAVPLFDQVQNPVSLLPSDNNGVLLTLPNVPATGAQAVSGSLMLGIGTAVNNTPPAGVSVFTTDQNGLLTTIYKGTTFGQSVIDSGSNGYFFTDQTLPLCAMPLQDFYCPASPTNLSATLVGANNHQAAIPFQVANTVSLVQTGNVAFNNLGGQVSTFVWGLPFFLGRTVYVGFESQPSALGTGPLLAF
jgi:uncharacterized protein DUF3443